MGNEYHQKYDRLLIVYICINTLVFETYKITLFSETMLMSNRYVLSIGKDNFFMKNKYNNNNLYIIKYSVIKIYQLSNFYLIYFSLSFYITLCILLKKINQNININLSY